MNKIKLMIEVDEGQEYENLKRGIGMADTLRNAKRIEESEDAISRQQVKSDYADWYGYGYQDNWFYKYLNSIPSVNPQQKVGHWIKSRDGYMRCDQCGSRGSAIKANFCHHCGAKMESGET